MTIQANLQQLDHSIREIASKGRRDPSSIRLVIVTKTMPSERVLEAYHAGHRDFGENRVQEWLEKREALPKDIRWHLIGHLQTNKVKSVVGQAALIQSLDRLDLADAIEKQARIKGIAEVPCLVQVNMSEEESKFGLDPARIEDFLGQLSSRACIKIRGLMTIGPTPGQASGVEEEARARFCFQKTRQLWEEMSRKFPQLSWDILSMGMSGDFKTALEEGSTMLRIGTLVFGERKG